MAEHLTCRAVREGLTEYLEKALPPPERQGLETHLAECPACARFLRELRGTIDTLEAAPRDPMPPSMKQEILRAFRHPSPPE